jgi:hypothetical protein
MGKGKAKPTQHTHDSDQIASLPTNFQEACRGVKSRQASLLEAGHEARKRGFFYVS